MGLTLDEIKTYLKIDGNFENDLLETLKTVSEAYLSEAGIKTDYDKATYKLSVLMLSAHWYSNRSILMDSTTKVTIQELPMGIRALIQQLQFAPQTVAI